MIYAQIRNELIVNTIILNDADDLHLFTDSFDYVLQIDQIYPRPGIGWTFDGIQFSAPASDSQGTVDTSQSDFQESITALNTINAPTGSDVLMANMSLTPGSGVYIVLFGCDILSSTIDAEITTSIYVSGVQVPGSDRTVIPYNGGLLVTPPGQEVISINQSVTVGDNQAIEIWWSSTATGPQASSRTLTILRI